MSTIAEYPELSRPERFTQEQLGWVPWAPAVPKNELTEAQRDALVEASRSSSPYFRLLARDPAALRARTLTDLDIFGNEDGGLALWERELAATASSRTTGCVYCASVHSARASKLSGRNDDVQRLLDEGVGVRVDERFDAIVDAAAALATTPPTFSTSHVERLRGAGLDDASIIDVVNGAAFFNWANRLMLSLGEPEVIA